MQSIINFHKLYQITDNELNFYSDETINIISDIIGGNFESYYASPNTLNNEQNYYGVIENYIGTYYVFALNNYELAEKYYIIAINKGDNYAANNLAIMYVKQNKCELAEKYYIIAIDKGNNNALNNLAIMYEKQNKCELAEKYYIIAINKGDNDALYNLADMYQKQEKYELAEKYYLIAIDKGDNDAMNNLANMYIRQKKYELAEKYYVMAINEDDNDSGAMNFLANTYMKQENYELAEKYYVMAIEKGNKNAMSNLVLLLKNDMRYFLCLTNINSAIPEIKKQIKQKKDQLMKNKSIYCFANKLILNSKVDECPICMISQSLIPYECSHFLCPLCYTKINKCPICKYPDICL